MRLERIDTEEFDWTRLDAFGERLVFHTPEWLAFVARTQDAEPVLAELRDGPSVLGFFTGLVVRRLGVRILGSPFPGWTTDYLGFVLEEGVSRRAAVEALVPFGYRGLGCLHLELCDRRLTTGELDGLGFTHARNVTFEVDLAPPEEEIFGRMASACRRNVRKAEKVGVVVEEAHDLGFADDYHAQLREVFARQSLRPPYPVERVRELIRSLDPTGNLLLLRARDPDGECIATGIFPGLGSTMFFWGGASRREGQPLRPNEAIFWYAMRYWKARGATIFDMGGGGDYKRKYGGRVVTIPWFRKSRVPGFRLMRELARLALTARQRVWNAR